MTALGESLPEILLDVGSTPTVSTTFLAPERNLWSSLFTTDASVFKQYSDFCDFDENAYEHVHTYTDVGFLREKVRKIVRSKVPEIAKNRQKTQA